jgi:hypothetical protein
MSVYLGNFGQIALKRQSPTSGLTSIVNPSDINTARKRFSFDFQPGQLLTGDQLEITSTNGAPLAFVDETGWANNTKQSSGKWFIHVDELGGVRLYSSFANALNGGTANAIILDTIVVDIPIRVTVENAIDRILGQITGYELNTNRETVDITALSEEFRSNYSSLMSGSGRISCLWDYRDTNGSGEYEVPHYLLQLALRTEIGSEFNAQLFLKTEGYSPTSVAGTDNDQIWYEINGIITAAAVQFSPESVVATTVDFITTGPVQLRTRTVAESAMLQENTSEILLDQDGTASLLLEADE